MSISFLQGNCLDVLKTLPDESIHCCVTSPPYYALRDYGVEGQLGLEQTPEAYINKMVEVFREVKRVLREDGTCWINIGDSYAGAGYSNQKNTGGAKKHEGGKQKHLTGTGLKNKDLVGIPWMLAFALRADGWYLRQDIIWHKPNPMPEPAKDRCVKAHEYIFLLSKSAKYFFDYQAIQEPKACWRKRGKGRSKHNADRGDNGDMAHFANKDFERGVRNKRGVWSVCTKSYKGAHFATFPPDLIRPCILAGTSEKGCCPDCGAPFERITEREPSDWQTERKEAGEPTRHGLSGAAASGAAASGAAASGAAASGAAASGAGGFKGEIAKTVGWRKSCACPEKKPVPCTVLDPFGGSGTTGQVAKEHGRNAILIELNPDYINLAKERCGES